MPFDPKTIRNQFPCLDQKVHGKPLVYLDNAATTHKPLSVLNAMEDFYRAKNSNVHRGVHHLSEIATQAFEESRRKVQKFVNAEHSEEIIFTRGTTESINLVASSYGSKFLKPGDEIILSTMEHHSNIVPWQMAAEATGAHLRVIPVSESGELMLDSFQKLLSDKTRILALVHVSNALGTINPVKEMAKKAKKAGAVVLLDGAQAIQHLKVDVRDLGCDFYAFSGHKIYGPTGIGVLYGRKALLEQMPPYQGGGDMIRHVTFGRTIYNTLPYKFEAGTPAIAEAIGLGAAVEFLESCGREKVVSYEGELLRYAEKILEGIPGLKILGKNDHRVSVVSFVMEGIHPHDIGTVVDFEGVAIRTGHHCAQPLMDRFQVPATARASLGIYNTKEDIDCLAKALQKTIEVFR